MNERKCAWCGDDFTGAITARYCGTTCEKAAQRARQKRRNVTDKGGDIITGSSICAWCGEGFTPKHPAARYCCDAHKMQAYRDRKRRKVEA